MFLFLGLAAWGVYQSRHHHIKMQALQQSLLECQNQADRQKEKHQQIKTEWEQTEEKLRGFLKLMDTLMNTIPNPIYFKDADGVFQGCNKVFAKQILGLTRDRIIGKRPEDLIDQIPAELAATYKAEEYKMVNKAGNHTFEGEVQCEDGRRRDFLFSLAPVTDANGDLSGSVAILSDLTDKNRAARSSMQKEKLEGVLETAGAICHELNQPLQALSGYTELLSFQLHGHEAQPDVEKLTEQIERMRTISEQLHRITRYESMDYSSKTKIIDIHKSSREDT
jgi:PAS domain S-box-containing protein